MLGCERKRKELSERAEELVTEGTVVCYGGKDPEQEPCAPRSTFRKEHESEERSPGPTSWAQLQVVSQSCFILNVVLVYILKTAL